MTQTPSNTQGRGWAYTGAILGGGISIAANVAHSFVPPAGAPDTWAPNTGAVIGSVFWPVLLFVAVEILARVRWPHGLWWGLLRFGGMLPVAAVAGLVSYRHLSSLLTFYGEDTVVSIAGPLAVDGLMVMATSALLVIARRTPAPATTTTAADTHTTETPTVVTPVRGYAPHSPATTDSDELPVTVPAHLLSAARFALANFTNTHTRPMTADDLAAAINVTPNVAHQLLTAISGTAPATTAHINGHAVAITAGAR